MVAVGLFQGPEFSTTVSANLGVIEDAARKAKADGATILVTPEMSVTGYNIGELIADRAEPADGPIYQQIRDIARRQGIAVVYGYPETNGTDLPFNSVQVVDADGERLANYRKTHLYGFDRKYFTPGPQWVRQFDFAGIRCGLLICYDIEFPENVRAHADAGTEWLIVPTGLMDPYGHVATQLVPTRAYESQLFVTYVNRCGTEGDLTYCGSTCAIAPDATPLGRAGAAEQLLITEIDPAAVAVSRVSNTHLDDRRFDLYGRDLYQENNSR